MRLDHLLSKERKRIVSAKVPGDLPRILGKLAERARMVQSTFDRSLLVGRFRTFLLTKKRKHAMLLSMYLSFYS